MAAIPGRWGGLRVEPYKPNPPDADLDGIIQEQTLWERPKGFVFAMVDAAGRLAEVVDGADHPPGVDVFRQNFVLARRGDNGVLERVDNAPRPSWDRGDLSPRDRFGTLSDRRGTIGSPKSPYVPMVEEVVDRPIDRRAELRKRYPDISDAGLEMMLWEATDDPDEIDRRLGFIENLYGEDVSTNLRQFLDGVPPGDRVDADFSEMADDLPGRPIYVNNYGDSPIDEISHAVFGFENEADAVAVCNFVPGVAGKSLASGMLADLRVKAEGGCSVEGGEGKALDIGEVAVVRWGRKARSNRSKKDRSPRRVGKRPRMWADIIEAYRNNNELAKDWDDATIENELMALWMTGNEHLLKKHFPRSDDRDAMTWAELRGLIKERVDAVVEEEGFDAALKRVETYYEDARAAISERADILDMDAQKFASMIAYMSPADDFDNNLLRAHTLADLLSKDNEIDADITRVIAYTLVNDSYFAIPTDKQAQENLEARLGVINEFLEKVYEGDQDGLKQAQDALAYFLGEVTDPTDPTRLRQDKTSTELKTYVKDLLENQDTLRVKKAFQPGMFGKDKDNIPVLEVLVNAHLKENGRPVRAGGGATNIIAALEVFYGHRDPADLSGPKTGSFFWSLYNMDDDSRAAVDTWILRALLPRDEPITLPLGKDARKRLSFNDIFDPASRTWQEAYVAKHGGRFEKIDGGFSWVPSTKESRDGRKFKESTNGFIDFVKTDYGWAMRGTVDALRAEPTGTGQGRLTWMIQSGRNVDGVGGNEGWARLIEVELERKAVELGVSPEVLQAAIWEYMRTTENSVSFSDGGFDYTPENKLHDPARVYDNLLGDLDTLWRYRKGHMGDKSGDAPSKSAATSKDLVKRRSEILTNQRLGYPLTEDDERFLRLLSTMTEDDIRVLSKRGNRKKSQRTIGVDMKEINESELSPELQGLLEDPEMRRILEESYIMFGPEEGPDDVINLLNEIPENS